MRINKNILIVALTFFIVLFSTIVNAQNVNSSEGFIKLFNGKNWDGWHLKLRNGDQKKAEEVFAIEDDMVHVFKNMKDSTDLDTGVNATNGFFLYK